MIIDTHKVQLFQQQGLFSDPVIDTGLVDSQVEILKSENIAVAVLKKLHLNERGSAIVTTNLALATGLPASRDLRELHDEISLALS